MAHLKNYLPIYSPLADLMGEFLTNENKMQQKLSTIPLVNIIESDKDFVIEFAAPGLSKEDFEIEIENEILSVKGTKKVEKAEENSQYSKREFAYNEFQRTFTLPDIVDSNSIEAEYKEGILAITIAKKPEAQVKPKRNISIK